MICLAVDIFSVLTPWTWYTFLFFFFFSLKTCVSYHLWKSSSFYFIDHFLFILFFWNYCCLDIDHLAFFFKYFFFLFSFWRGINYAKVFSNISVEKCFCNCAYDFLKLFLWWWFLCQSNLWIYGCSVFWKCPWRYSWTFMKTIFSTLSYLCLLW